MSEVLWYYRITEATIFLYFIPSHDRHKFDLNKIQIK